jgi:hypothetical protein
MVAMAALAAHLIRVTIRTISESWKKEGARRGSTKSRAGTSYWLEPVRRMNHSFLRIPGIALSD